MRFVRQGATHKIVVGPFVDVGDGFTPETGITLGAADEAEAIVEDSGTVVDLSSGYTWAAITSMDGYYNLTLQSGISGTVGCVTVVVQDDSVCLPVKAEFTVVEEAVYDAFFAASATGVPTLAALEASVAAVQAVLPSVGPVEGTADSGSTTSLTDAARTEGDDFWNNMWIEFTSGTLAGKAALVSDFDAASDTMTLTPTLPAAVSTHTYRMVPASQIGAAIAVGTVTGNVGGSVASVTGAVGSVAGNVDGSVGSVAGNVDGTVAVVTTNTDMRGTDSAALATALATAQTDLDTITGTDGVTLATAQALYAPALASVATEARLAELDAANLPADVDTINTATGGLAGAAMRGTDSAATAASLATAQTDLDTLTGTDGATLATTQGNYAPLKPTTAGRTLDVTTGGAAGIDWGNVENPTTAVDLSGTDIQLADTVTTLTGHTVQTGDSFAKWTTAIADSVPADGTIPSPEQALYMITQFLMERSVSSTTVTVKKADGSTSLLTLTLDDATTPTSITRAT